MDGLLSLKWNNHSSSFIRQFATLRSKSLYCDATVICEGVYFSVHKLILSTCSDYFSEIFENIQCKHPFIIIKDVGSTDMEILLNYMYEGEVNVLQDRLPNLIKAAEALKVKGLAVPDDESFQSKKNVRDKHSASNCIDIHAKRKTEDFADVIAPNSVKKLKNTNEDLESKVMENELEQCNLTNQSDDRSLSNSSFIDHLLNNDQDVKKEPIGTTTEEISANFLQQESVELGPNSLNSVNSDQSLYADQLSPSKVQFSSWINNADDSATDSQSLNLVNENQNSSTLLKAVNSLRPFTDVAWLTKTFNAETTSGKPFELPIRQCPYCPYTTTIQTNLKSHIMFRHTHEKPYQCKHCSYRTATKGNMKKHLIIHEKQ